MLKDTLILHLQERNPTPNQCVPFITTHLSLGCCGMEERGVCVWVSDGGSCVLNQFSHTAHLSCLSCLEDLTLQKVPKHYDMNDETETRIHVSNCTCV